MRADEGMPSSVGSQLVRGDQCVRGVSKLGVVRAKACKESECAVRQRSPRNAAECRCYLSP